MQSQLELSTFTITDLTESVRALGRASYLHGKGSLGYNQAGYSSLRIVVIVVPHQYEALFVRSPDGRGSYLCGMRLTRVSSSRLAVIDDVVNSSPQRVDNDQYEALFARPVLGRDAFLSRYTVLWGIKQVPCH